MTSLTVRNVPEDAKRRFRQVAAAHGRSMEEAGRRLIMADVTNDDEKPGKSIGQMLFEMSRPGIELPIPPRTRARIPDLSEE